MDVKVLRKRKPKHEQGEPISFRLIGVFYFLDNNWFIFLSSAGYNRCCLVGHDWGGTIAWLFAIHYPEMVTKLIVLNCPHPSVFTGRTSTAWTSAFSHISLSSSLLSVLIKKALLGLLLELLPLIRMSYYFKRTSASSWQILFILRGGEDDEKLITGGWCGAGTAGLSGAGRAAEWQHIHSPTLCANLALI